MIKRLLRRIFCCKDEELQEAVILLQEAVIGLQEEGTLLQEQVVALQVRVDFLETHNEGLNFAINIQDRQITSIIGDINSIIDRLNALENPQP